MSFIKLDKSLFETSTIILRNKVTYTSSSSGIVGARKISKRALSVKNTNSSDLNSATQYSDSSITNVLNINNDNSDALFYLTHGIDANGNPVQGSPFDGSGTTDTNVVPALFHMTENLLNLDPQSRIENFITGVFYDYDADYLPLSNTNESGVYSFPQKNIVHPIVSSATQIASEVNIPSNLDQIYAGIQKNHKALNPYTNQVLFNLKSDINDNSVEKMGSRAIIKKADIKKTVADHLMPYYKTHYNNCDMSYSNFNCLNLFYDPDSHTGKECLVYNSGFQSYLTDFRDDGTAHPRINQFTFSCWVNPRYENHTANGDMNTGTIFHASSSLAVSLVTGSNRDSEGYADHYRLMVQLKHSAAKNPSSFLVTGSSNRIDDGRYPHDLIYLTDDNSIKRNTWNYISVKWGKNINNDQLTLRVNDKNYKYTIPSASVSETNTFGNETTTGVPYAFVGNYFDGKEAEVHKFFSSNKALINFARSVSGGADNNPSLLQNSYINQFQGELHELRVFGKYLSDSVEEKYRYTSFDEGNQKHVKHNLNLYLPFNYDSLINTTKRPGINPGSVLFNPSLYGDIITGNPSFYNLPSNPYISHGIGGKYINVHNFTTNFGRSKMDSYSRSENVRYAYSRPIHYQLSASLAEHSFFPSLLSTRDTLQNQTSVVKRNNLISPCDNGYFKPNYYLRESTSFRNKNDIGNESYETVSLKNMVSGSLIDGREFPIYYVTKDDMSNDMSIFIISSLYYGERIHPGSFTITDDSILGTSEKVKYTLKDDGRGSLYRADSDGDHAKWASVGNIFYDEGIVLVKSPHMPYFGKNKYKIEFKGEQSTHVTTVHVPCPEELFMSSSNPTYKLLTGSLDEGDKNNPFVYITGVNIHDDNLNVIMKCKLAQPVKKRKTDSYLFRLKQDY